MTPYQHYIGIDISKHHFTVALHGQQSTWEFLNNNQGFERLLSQFAEPLKQALVVLETTGGYEMELLLFLLSQDICVHRANTLKLKHFIRSWGVQSKTDRIDALGIARYAQERHASLEQYVVPSQSSESLRVLLQRREDLKKILVQEKNRLSAPNNNRVRASCRRVIRALEAELSEIATELESEVSQEPGLQEQRMVLETVPGVGKQVSLSLLGLLPELGRLNRREVASLCGLAPYPRESGMYQGYRRTRGGRSDVRRILFMAAMACARSKSRLGDYYQGLLARGKKKMVALTALMRKIIVIANARMRDYYMTTASKT